jgi:dihydropteroate synthase
VGAGTGGRVVWWGMAGARRAVLAGIAVGDGCPVAVLGVLNVSPESFHAGSVRGVGDLLEAGRAMVEAGAAALDVGARSTAPYGERDVSEAEEADRLGEAVASLAGKLGVPVSADTARPGPARAALEAGAAILNDVTGLADAAVARLAAAHEAGLVLMAHPGGRPLGDPVGTVRERLAAALERARAAGIPEGRVVLDPGIGFFRGGAVEGPAWDVSVLAGLDRLAALGRPLCVGVSRKSFLGALTGRRDPAGRLAGSLAAATLAVAGGAALIRTHDVAETVDAVRVAERLRGARAG